MATLLRPRLLILDEIGSTPLERPEATFLFEIVAKRYDRRNLLIVTSNKSWSAWGDILPDQVMTAAILDRLVHRSVTLTTQSETYRLRQHRSAGLVPSPWNPQNGGARPLQNCQIETGVLVQNETGVDTPREYGYCSQILIDAYLECGGIWLDRGELDTLEVFFKRERLRGRDARHHDLPDILEAFLAGLSRMPRR